MERELETDYEVLDCQNLRDVIEILDDSEEEIFTTAPVHPRESYEGVVLVLAGIRKGKTSLVCDMLGEHRRDFQRAVAFVHGRSTARYRGFLSDVQPLRTDSVMTYLDDVLNENKILLIFDDELELKNIHRKVWHRVFQEAHRISVWMTGQKLTQIPRLVRDFTRLVCLGEITVQAAKENRVLRQEWTYLEELGRTQLGRCLHERVGDASFSMLDIESKSNYEWCIRYPSEAPPSEVCYVSTPCLSLFLPRPIVHHVLQFIDFETGFF
jgi:hypothetical protein